MNTLFLNPATWDLMVDAEGNIAMAEAPYSMAQDVASACRLWSGEARYNITRGIPYENSILGKLPPMSLLASWYQKEVETVPEVAKAQAVLDFDRSARRLGGRLQITTESGETNVLNI